MSTFWRYLRIQAFMLLCGIVGPIFLIVYLVSGGSDPTLKWMFWVGLLITAVDILIPLGITAARAKSTAQEQKLEQCGVLGLAQVTEIHETGTRINDQPLVKLDLQISAPGLATFTTQDRVVASVSRLPMITNGTLVALVDPATREYRIDWQRSRLVGGSRPVTFRLAAGNRTVDLTGQTGPLMEILRILKDHNVDVTNMSDAHFDPVVRQQVQAVVRRAAAAQNPEPAPVAGPVVAPPVPSTAQRLQELETLRATGTITEDEYSAKRREIIADL